MQQFEKTKSIFDFTVKIYQIYKLSDMNSLLSQSDICLSIYRFEEPGTRKKGRGKEQFSRGPDLSPPPPKKRTIEIKNELLYDGGGQLKILARVSNLQNLGIDYLTGVLCG